MNCRLIYCKDKRWQIYQFSFISFLIILSLVGCANDSTHRVIECAPYARELTGVKLKGSAYNWWGQARGKYRRTRHPREGAILVFRKTRRLPDGHVSVVRSIKNSRNIIVDHANWQPNHINHEAPIMDVSLRNDWSLVKVWWPPSQRMGTGRYPTYGFIIP